MAYPSDKRLRFLSHDARRSLEERRIARELLSRREADAQPDYTHEALRELQWLGTVLDGAPTPDALRTWYANRVAPKLRAAGITEPLPESTVCDSCAGKGVDLRGEVCGCGGTGRLADMATYLRQLLYDADLRVKLADEALRRIQAHVEGELSGPGPRIGSQDGDRQMLSRIIRVIDDAVRKYEDRIRTRPGGTDE